MRTLLHGWVLALAGLAAMTVSAQAGWLGYRNDLSHPVVLQATNEKGQQGKPLVLQPGESNCDWVNDTSARKIAVLDGREKPPRTELVRFDASTPDKGDTLYVIRMTTKDGKKFIEVLKTNDTGRKKK